MKLDNELYSLMSGIQDILLQAAQADNFAPSEIVKWDFRQEKVNRAFSPTKGRLIFTMIDFSRRGLGSYGYEQLLFSKHLHGELNADAQDIYTTYSLTDTHGDIELSGTIKCYIHHPEAYKQALIDAGAISTSTYSSEVVNCGI